MESLGDDTGVDDEGIRVALRPIPEGRVQRDCVAVVDRRVQQRPSRRGVTGVEGFSKRPPGRVARPFGPGESGAPPGDVLLALGVDDRVQASSQLRVGRQERERAGERFAGARHVEHHRAHQRPERRSVAQHRHRTPSGKREATIGRRRLDTLERPGRAGGVSAEEARLGSPHGNRGRPIRQRRTFEPELRARAVALDQIEVRELEERVAPRRLTRLGDGERADERIPDVARRCLGRTARPRQSHPDLGLRRDQASEVLEREGQLRVEMGGLGGVGQEREPDGGIGRLRVSRRCAAARARIGSPETSARSPSRRSSSGPREDDLDFADPATDDVSEAHRALRCSHGESGRKASAIGPRTEARKKTRGAHPNARQKTRWHCE